MRKNSKERQLQVGKAQPSDEAYAQFQDGSTVTLDGLNKKVADTLFDHLNICHKGGCSDEVEIQFIFNDKFEAKISVIAFFEINEEKRVRTILTSVLDDSVIDKENSDNVTNARVVINEKVVNTLLQELIQDDFDSFLKRKAKCDLHN